jgi:hypothetical protein
VLLYVDTYQELIGMLIYVDKYQELFGILIYANCYLELIGVNNKVDNFSSTTWCVCNDHLFKNIFIFHCCTGCTL